MKKKDAAAFSEHLGWMLAQQLSLKRTHLEETIFCLHFFDCNYGDLNLIEVDPASMILVHKLALAQLVQLLLIRLVVEPQSCQHRASFYSMERIKNSRSTPMLMKPSRSIFFYRHPLCQH
jgi:hypothetical protein